MYRGIQMEIMQPKFYQNPSNWCIIAAPQKGNPDIDPDTACISEMGKKVSVSETIQIILLLLYQNLDTFFKSLKVFTSISRYYLKVSVSITRYISKVSTPSNNSYGYCS